MASRKEQKERLRLERQRREQEAHAAARRRHRILYAAAGVAAVVAVALVVVLVSSGSGGGRSGGSVLPGGGKVPAQRQQSLAKAAAAAGCELKSYKAPAATHTTDINERITYASKPPTSGRHFDTPADDGAYGTAVNPKRLLHSMEHGRVVVWFRKSLPKADRANLKALFDEDPYQLILTPDASGMSYAVAATAWNGDPKPNGTGRLLGCPRFSAGVYDAVRAFKDEHRSNGPEAVP